MIKKQSAGLLLYRLSPELVEVFLVHPGGPFWKNKDEKSWSVPKGEFDEKEKPLQAAIREFKEETGVSVSGNFIELKPVTQKAGKKVYAWALEKDINAEKIYSNTFEMEWPPRSGKYQSFPEVDKGKWFTIEEAMKKINATQATFIEELLQKLKLV